MRRKAISNNLKTYKIPNGSSGCIISWKLSSHWFLFTWWKCRNLNWVWFNRRSGNACRWWWRITRKLNLKWKNDWLVIRKYKNLRKNLSFSIKLSTISISLKARNTLTKNWTNPKTKEEENHYLNTTHQKEKEVN